MKEEGVSRKIRVKSIERKGEMEGNGKRELFNPEALKKS